MGKVTKSILVITGPTGSSKSKWAEEVRCDDWPTLFNADAFQFYREIPILSNQPDEKQRGHYKFLADLSLSRMRNAGDFARETEPLLDDPGIWVGTGLYLGAALYGLDQTGIKGTPFQGEARRSVKMVVLDPPRKSLYERLDSRVDNMIDRGAVEEAARIGRMVAAGEIDSSHPVLKAIGLKHLLCVEQKELQFEEAVQLWKRDTRRLAKRQWTWLRKFCPPGSNCLWISESAEIVDMIQRFFRDDRCSF
jgi:tRNA A37 N6-isopentenylltransferase MiaA